MGHLQHAGAAPIGDETRLVLYALHQQAVVGPCKEPKPWSWNIVESAKWNSWSQLKDMSSVEAMRLYVKLLEEEVQVSRVADPDARSVPSISPTPVHCAALLGDHATMQCIKFPTVLQPDWWVLARSADLQKDAPPPNAAAEGSKKQRSLRDSAVQGSWAAADLGGAKRPPPRYEHAVALVRRTLYVVGGNCGEGLLCLAARPTDERCVGREAVTPEDRAKACPIPRMSPKRRSGLRLLCHRRSCLQVAAI